MLTNIGNSYTDQIVDAIRNTIQNTAKQGGATAKDLKEAIKKTLKENEWRIERIANTEEHRADNLGQVDAVKELGKATGKQFGLKWKTTSAEPCAFCQYMNGTIVKAGEAFVPLGGKIESDDAVYLNDYENMMTPNAHPNCKCVFDVVEL
jgi:hypothetical protein